MPKKNNLFKRGETYYAKIQIAKKLHRISLKTSNLALAKQKAAALRRELEYGNLEILEKMRGVPESSTIGDLMECFDTFWLARRRAKRTAKDYKASLMRILQATHPKHSETALRKLPLTVLTPALLEKYQEKKLAEASDHADLQKKLESLKSEATQARALVSPRSLRSEHFKRLKVPDLTDFRMLELEKPEQRGYRSPSIEMIQRTIKEAEILRSIEKPRWYAFILAIGVGLRRSEGVAARWDWLATVPVVVPQLDGSSITTADIQLRIDITNDFRTKRSQRVVSVDAAIADAMQTTRDQALPHIIPLATKTARDNCFRENARWLRKIGWDEGRPNHHLRKFFADHLRQLYGLEAAQRAMGHKNQRTTEAIYTGNGGVGQTASFLQFAEQKEAAQ